jgi:hypothetical protein
MKPLFLIGLLLASSTCFAQKENELTDTIPKVNGSYEYTEVVKVDSSFKKDDLYKNAKLYFVNSYKSANDVIQYDEKSEGRIIGKGFFKEVDTYDAFLTVTIYTWNVNYSTEIICKEGKYKYRMYDITIRQATTGKYASVNDISIDEAIKNTKKGAAKKLFTRLLNKTMADFKLSISVLKQSMTKQNSLSAKNDF